MLAWLLNLGFAGSGAAPATTMVFADVTIEPAVAFRIGPTVEPALRADGLSLRAAVLGDPDVSRGA